VDALDTTCTPICTEPVCGDGFVSMGEACDDGNVVDGDDCTANCTVSICGDSMIAGDEECDDGNMGAGDACGADCLRDTRFVFVSSLRYAGGAIGTVGYADMQCQMLAKQALLPGTYRAWLSNGAVSPATRFSKSLDRAYVLPKSVQSGLAKKVADGWVDLVDGTLMHEINVTEKGEELTSSLSCEVETQMAWTATSRSAGPFDTSTHCDQWTTSVGTAHGVAGLIGSTDVKARIYWTEGCPQTTCDRKARLYCFEHRGSLDGAGTAWNVPVHGSM
jgi:cysteine-rich repeat protein